mmetsp:Transcript_15658/g.33941  ORF Transcript_15658/g.33941 Transcript_15658/m.33941 type:complete len:485 (-) Transcript_15658:399-1853(-)
MHGMPSNPPIHPSSLSAAGVVQFRYSSRFSKVPRPVGYCSCALPAGHPGGRVAGVGTSEAVVVAPPRRASIAAGRAAAARPSAARRPIRVLDARVRLDVLPAGVVALGRPDEDLAGAGDAEALLLHHLGPLGDPAGDAGEGEHAGEHVGGDADGAQHDARVEVHVGVELALDEVLVRQGDALQLHRHLQARVLHVHHAQHVLHELAEVLGAGVVVLVDAVAEAHEAHAALLVLHLAHKLRHVLLLADGREHVNHRLVGAAVRGAPQGRHTRRHARVRVGLGGAGDADGGGGGVLLVVGVQDQEHVHRLCDRLVDLLGVDLVHAVGGLVHGVLEHHAQEVLRVVEVCVGVRNGQAQVVAVHHGGDHGHLGDHAHCRVPVLLDVLDIDGDGVEGGQARHHGGHLGHGVCSCGEVVEEIQQVLLQEHVLPDLELEIVHLRNGGKLSVQQKVAGLEEVRLLRELIDRVSTVRQDALVAVNKGDAGRAA